MIEVTKEEFYKAMGPLNVRPHIVSKWPYKTEWRLGGSHGNLVGISQATDEYTKDGVSLTKYYLTEARHARVTGLGTSGVVK